MTSSIAISNAAEMLQPPEPGLSHLRLDRATELAAARGGLTVDTTEADLAVRRDSRSIREALLAITLDAAWALDRATQIGSPEIEERGDVVVLDGPVDVIAYRPGRNPVLAIGSSAGSWSAWRAAP